MNKGSVTKDEKFLLALYEYCQERKDFDEVVDCYEIGNKARLTPKQVEAICTQLIRANFIKRKDKQQWIFLTSNGMAFVENMLKQ